MAIIRTLVDPDIARWKSLVASQVLRKNCQLKKKNISLGTGRGRTVPLYREMRALLEVLPRSGVYVLGIGRRRPDASAISHAWTRTIRALRAGGHSISPISLHGLRHSYATWLASNGLSLHALRALLGHADIQTTMLYVHMQPQMAVEAARKIEAENAA